MSDYDITQIPAIMRTKGWTRSAALMDHWFKSAANNDPAKGAPDTTTITMAWVLGFSRAATVYNDMLAQKVWANPAAQREIAADLGKQGLLVGQAKAFGGPAYDVVRLDEHYVQERSVLYNIVNQFFSDELIATLGNFPFRVAVGGQIVPKKSQHTIQIEKVWIYVRKPYTFNDRKPGEDELLGRWSDSGGPEAPLGTNVRNSTFRSWRTANGKGGDFLIFSHPNELTRSPPDTFDI
jgi:hypothetical protein